MVKVKMDGRITKAGEGVWGGGGSKKTNGVEECQIGGVSTVSETSQFKLREKKLNRRGQKTWIRVWGVEMKIPGN